MAEALADGGELAVLTDVYVEAGARGVGVGELLLDAGHRVGAASGAASASTASPCPGMRESKNFFEAAGLVARAIVVHKRLGGPTVSGRRPEVCVGAIVVVDGPAAAGAPRPRAGGGVRGRCPADGWRRARPWPKRSCVSSPRRPGVEGVCGELLGWVERIADDHHFVILDFACTLLDDREPVAGDDAAEVAWVPSPTWPSCAWSRASPSSSTTRASSRPSSRRRPGIV